MSVESAPKAPRRTDEMTSKEVDKTFNQLAYTLMDPENPATERPENTHTGEKNDSLRDSGDFTQLDPERPENFAFNVRETLTEVALSAAHRFGEVIRGRENGETGKDRLKRTGRSALRAAGDLTVVSLGVTYLSVEAAKNGAKITMKKIMVSAKRAVASFQERRAKRRQEKQRSAEHAEAKQMNERWDQETEAEQMNRAYDETYDKEFAEAEARNKEEDALDAEHAEAEAMNRAYDRDSAQNFHEERLKADEELRAEQAHEARVKARAASYKKVLRQKARAEKFGEYRERASTRYAKVKNGIRRGLRSAWHGLKRTGKRIGSAAAAGVKATAASWNASK